ncbi:AraC family transcriptional regulator [Lysinibacillus sphaericus]|uniref:AraC family transcriptional regulator n=1 Tax=Lysinibacillus sphaericus TaxID=1421 RepID=UPI00296E3E5D
MNKKKTHSTKSCDNARMSLNDVRNYMANHFDQPLSIDYLALITGLSPNYFGEAFKKAYGQSATDYLTELRIGQAKQLLRDTDFLLRDIAQKVGYNDEFYFSRKFKKEVGVSPSFYSKASRKRISTFSVSAIGNLLALGVIPVAAPLNAKWSPYYYYYYHSEISIHLNIFDAESEDNFKKLLSAKPDIVIVHEKTSIDMVNWLETAGIQIISIGNGDWKTQLREIALEVKKQSQCENLIQSYEQKALQAKKEIKQHVGEDIFVVLRLSGDKLFLYSNNGIRDVISQDLQLTIIDVQKEPCNEQISIDQLLELNPERLLILLCPDTDTRLYWLSLQHLIHWKKLKAVKNGHIYLIPSNPWFEYSAIAINRMLDEMLMMLTGKNPNPFPVPVHGVLSDTEL